MPATGLRGSRLGPTVHPDSGKIAMALAQGRVDPGGGCARLNPGKIAGCEVPGAEAMITTRAMVLWSGLTALGVSKVGDERAAVDQSRMTATDATTVYPLRLRPPAMVL